MMVSIAVLGHLAAAYLHSLFAYHLYKSRKDNALSHGYYFLVIVFACLHSVAFLWTLAAFLHWQPLAQELISALKPIFHYLFPAFYFLFCVGLFREMPTPSNKLARALHPLAMYAMPISATIFFFSVLFITGNLVSAFVEHRVWGLVTIFHWRVGVFIFLLSSVMWLSGLRVDNKLIADIRLNPLWASHKRTIVSIWIVWSLTSIPRMVTDSEFWIYDINSMISTSSFIILFGWIFFRAQFLDIIVRRFFLILSMILAVIGTIAVINWTTMVDSSLQFQLLVMMICVCCSLLLIRLGSRWSESLWKPSQNNLALIHREVPLLLTSSSNAEQAIVDMEKYLGKLFIANVGINRKLENAVNTLSIGLGPPIVVQLSLRKSWLPWFSEALQWVRTAILYLHNHLQLLQSLKLIEQQKIESQQFSALAADAELSAMRTRIQPQFLFDTLHKVHEEIGSNPQQAEKSIEQLADLMRQVLQSDPQDPTVKKETV